MTGRVCFGSLLSCRVLSPILAQFQPLEPWVLFQNNQPLHLGIEVTFPFVLALQVLVSGPFLLCFCNGLGVAVAEGLMETLVLY